jgi:hypothetical protein
VSSNAVKLLQVAAPLLAVAGVAACTNSGVDVTALVNTPAAAHYSIGGTVSGLTSSGLELQSNTGEKLQIIQNGTFHFNTTLTSGSSYYVLVSVQPQAPSQTCSVTNSTGSISSANVSNVQVSCQNKTSQTDSIGGIVVGATGSGLVLQNNGADALPVPSNGPFTFATQLSGGTAYSVSVLSPPINPYQNCSVSNSPGMTAGSDVSNIVVSCTVNSNPTHTIGGTVTGLAQGTTLVLQDNGRDNLSVKSNGSFTFPMAIPSGGAYSVSVQSVSSGTQSQTCLVQNASAVVGQGNVTSVAVQCTSNLGLTVSVAGLSGSGLVLQNTANGDSLPVASSGSAVFQTALAPGTAYSVTVLSQPKNPNQTCAVTNGAGTAGAMPGPTVNCVTQYTVGGIVTGLPDPTAGTNLANLVLILNGDTNPADEVTIPPTATSPYGFSFPVQLLSGSTYSVTVSSQPGANLNTSNTSGVVQTSTVCVVSAGAGTVTSASASSVVVNCVQPIGFAYVTNSGDNTVSAYLIGQTGALLPSGPAVQAGVNPSGAAAYSGGAYSTPTAGFLFVSNQGSNSLSVYTIDPNTGALTAASANTAALNITAPTSIIEGYVPSTVPSTFYIAGTKPGASQTQVSAVSIGMVGTTLTLTNLSNSPATNQTVGPPQVPLILSEPAAGTDFYITAARNSVLAYPVDPATGGFLLQPPPANQSSQANVSAGVASPTSIAVQSIVDADLVLSGADVYVADSSTNTISMFSQTSTGTVSVPATGTTTSPTIPGLGSLAIADATTSPCGSYLYATGSDGVHAYSLNGIYAYPVNGVCRYSVNPNYAPSAGAYFTAVTNSPFAAGGGPGPIAATREAFSRSSFPDTENFLYVANVTDGTVSGFSIDLTTGQLTPVPGAPPKTGALPSSISVRPRPSYAGN